MKKLTGKVVCKRIIPKTVSVIQVHEDFYTVTTDNVHLHNRRRCFGCRKKLEMGDRVSVVITDDGNKLLCRSCFETARKEAP